MTSCADGSGDVLIAGSAAESRARSTNETRKSIGTDRRERGREEGGGGREREGGREGERGREGEKEGGREREVGREVGR